MVFFFFVFGNIDIRSEEILWESCKAGRFPFLVLFSMYVLCSKARKNKRAREKQKDDLNVNTSVRNK